MQIGHIDGRTELLMPGVRRDDICAAALLVAYGHALSEPSSPSREQ
jgi:hypothetical protein